MSALTVLALAAALSAPDWEADLDVRLVSSNDRSGTVRFDDSQSGPRLGRARFAVSEALGEVWSLHVDASYWGDHDRNPVDLTETYLQFRPYPFSGGYRFHLRAGAFYAPISLENRASGWESPYTLSYSAINTWLAQELRTVGAEAQIDWLGTRTGHSVDLALVGGVFGWNDPAGVVIANQGFSLSDRQTTLFGSQPAEVFGEIDHRAGFYAGVEARYFDRITIRALHYDNRGDPTAFDAATHNFAWDTHFNAVGVRAESGNGWTAIAQYLDGETAVAPASGYLDWHFKARYGMVSREMGRHRISLQYDSFAATQHGHAWTAAYVFEPDRHWRFTLEGLHVVKDGENQATQLQLAVRFALGPLAR